MKFTLSVRSFHVPATSGTWACPPSFPSVPTSRATRVTSPANALSWSTIVLMVFFQFKNFSLHVYGDFARQVASSHSGCDFSDISYLSREVSGHGVYGVSKIFPSPGDARYHSLSAKFSVRSHFARHARHFGSERAQLIYHRVDGFFQLQNFAAHIHRDFARQVTARHSSCNFCDVTHLPSQVAGHRVHGVGQIFPRSGHTGHLRLSAKFSVRTHFAGHACHLSGKHAQLLNHGVDDLGGAQEFAFQGAAIHVQADGLSQVALGHSGDRAGNFNGRTQQVIGQRVDRDFHLTPGAARLLKP